MPSRDKKSSSQSNRPQGQGGRQSEQRGGKQTGQRSESGEIGLSSQSGQTGKHSGQGEGRGFAGMDPERQREIAAEGGRAAHEQGTAHEFDSDEARAAGRKSRQGGGKQTSQNPQAGKQTGGQGSRGR